VSGRTVTVSFATAGGTATPGADFSPASGGLTFAPGETGQAVPVDVLGDTAAEPDESFSLALSNLVNATPGPAGAGVILDDDFAGPAPPELTHGALLVADAAGGTPDLYRLAQAPLSSYEVVLDAVSGDLFPGLQLERLDSDGATVAQVALPIGSGAALSLRFENASASAVYAERLRVGSPGCGAGCGPEDVYRLRAYDTTARIARFNNSATQVTTVVLENPTASTVSGSMHFRVPNGAPLLSQAFGIAPRGTFVFATSSAPALLGQSGSITVSHDAPYGALTGKAVALEPATGFSFDSPLQPRPR
jgi:hypothetical protein